ncbi:MAG: diguanylate cyclase domain-containing protein [Gammaproteobacteria bacterium]
MYKPNLYGITNITVAGLTNTQPHHLPQQEGFENPVRTQLLHPFLEPEELKRALATSQQQLKAAQQQIETLAETNAYLRRRSVRLAKKCAQARHFAYHDELTGLPNRSLLMDRLKQAMVQSARQNKQVALLFIDLDGFKSVNDRLGHSAGDKLLQLVADRLTSCIRYGDTACRYGGDEFVILLPEIDGQESAEVVTEKIRAHLAVSYEVDGNNVEISASIGVAVYRTGGQNCSDLIKQADMAMYHAKTSTPCRPCLFEPAIHNKN